MKLQIKILIVTLSGVTFFSACSRKKDAFVNRNFHAMATKNNVLFNGRNAFELGKKELADTYNDNYWEILPVERLAVSGDIKLDSESSNANFQKAEEKATKAIQKHSMNIKGEEVNPKMDDAFLLLGKSRYFDERFLPALEAFNYILYKYAESNKRIEANIWREKVNIRLDNNETAIKNLNRLLKLEEMSNQEYADATSTMGQAYINLGKLDSALISLKTASLYTRKNDEKGRYAFIVGQLYNRLGKKDSANYAFDKVIDLNRKSPRVYMINAEIQKAINFDYTNGDKEAFYEHLLKLEKNRENRPFLDKINRELAAYYFQEQQDSLAIVYLNRSLRATQQDVTLNSMNYRDLADYYFDKTNYQKAGSYYDSTLTNLPENSKLFRAISKRRENLEDVIKYEQLVAKHDSIITLTRMSKEEQVAYFEKYIKEQEEKKAAEAAAKEAKVNAGLAGFNTTNATATGGEFYFYNTVAMGYGKSDFKNRWGDRKLEDNWRWSDKSIIEEVEDNQVEAETGAGQAPIASTDSQKPQFYIDQLPKDPKKIDSLVAERNFANYQLGLIYKEKFKEYLLAVGKLKSVLENNPEQKLIIPSKYNLYKIYSIQQSPLAEQMKQDIIANHSNSRYADILRNPEALLEASNQNTPSAVYTKLYKLFENQQYEKVISGVDRQIVVFNGDAIVPKLELLKASAQGRLHGFEAYKKALNYVALNYPNDKEGKEAQHIIDTQLSKLQPNAFVQQVNGKWKLVYPIAKNDQASWDDLHKVVTHSFKEEKRADLKISKDVYDGQQLFLVIHSFPSKEFAEGFAELLNKNKKYQVNNENFVVLSENYKIIQIHKNLQTYLNK